MKIYYEDEIKTHYTKFDGYRNDEKETKKLFGIIKITESSLKPTIEFDCLHCTFKCKTEKDMKEHIIKKHQNWLRAKGHIHFRTMSDSDRKF